MACFRRQLPTFLPLRSSSWRLEGGVLLLLLVGGGREGLGRGVESLELDREGLAGDIGGTCQACPST